MSQASIQAALEKQLAAIDAAFQYIRPNTGVAPTGPHLVSFFMPNEPDNSVSGNAFCDRGLFKVHVKYPLGKGVKDAVAKAEQVRAAFKRSTTFVQGSVNVQITHTPTIHSGFEDGAYWLVPVTVMWQAWVFS